MTIAIITEAGVRKVAPLVVSAQQAAVSAALSAQVALAVEGGRIFASYAAGNAATTAGQYFIVATTGSLALHINGTATAIANIAVLDPSTGVLLLPNGSAAVPAVSFVSDPDTGLYRFGANSLGVTLAGTASAVFTTTGTGLGVSAPYCRLEGVSAINTPTFAIGQDPGAANLGLEFIGRISAVPAGQTRGFIATGDSTIGTAGDLIVAPRSNAGCSVFVATGSSGAVKRWQFSSAGALLPVADNSYPLGGASNRCTVIWATTGTINTSDATEKEWIETGFSAAELAAAKRIAGEVGSYKWLAAIARENDGGPAARVHFGVRAQAVWAIMADEGLIDPIEEGVAPSCPYAFLCWDPMEEGDTVGRFGIRPDQLAMFLIAAQEARIAALEALTEGE